MIHSEQSALIGYTGFVGQNLQQQHAFGHFFNSKNFRKMLDKAFSAVVCCGISAVKWKANKFPAEDREAIRRLQDVVATVETDFFVLISTIDVYPVLKGADESFDCHGVTRLDNAYGNHRLEFEDFIRARFPSHLIVRLPHIFGDGLKKGCLYDLLNDNMVDKINPESRMQFYDLAGLWEDIQMVAAAKVNTINLFPEPVLVQEILDRCFRGMAVGTDRGGAFRYDLHTAHAEVFGNAGRYRYDAGTVHARIAHFVQSYDKARPPIS